MEQIPIISIVAYSGTGKTTLLEKVIYMLKQRGLRICVIKHDSHDFQVDQEGKDSWRMTQAGADMTILSNDRKTVVFENRSLEIEDILTHIHDVDLILTEGYKGGKWKKIALYRKTLGNPFPCALEECIAVVTDTFIDTAVPCFAFEEIDALADYIVQEIDKKSK